jgi:heme/copper-type cytochrome/quinol oxidase subunit 4
MDKIVPRDMPVIAAAIVLTALGFWLMARAVDRGWFDRPVRPMVLFGLSLVFGVLAVWHTLDRAWWWAAFYVVGTVCYAFSGWRRLQHR